MVGASLADMLDHNHYGLKKQILLLFESADDFDEIKNTLANPLFDYSSAHSLYEAYQTLQSARVDMVITAVHLENSDTYEFLNRMQSDSDWRNIPFVFVSVRRSDLARSIDHGLALAARALGARAYISIDELSPPATRALINACFSEDALAKSWMSDSGDQNRVRTFPH